MISDQHVLTDNAVFMTSQNVIQNITQNIKENTEKNVKKNATKNDTNNSKVFINLFNMFVIFNENNEFNNNYRNSFCNFHNNSFNLNSRELCK